MSETSETSAEADASADTSDASKDTSEESDSSDEPSDELSDEPSDEVSKEQDNSTTPKPNETSKEEASRPDEVSKPAEESKVEETSKNEETSKAEDAKPTHTHTWKNATCTAPKTCKDCGAIEGEANDHDWASATCLAPQTCKTCGQTAGSVTAHSYENGKCKHCGDEKEVVTGDTPVDIVINGKQESVDSYEEAVKALTLKDLEDMAAGETIVLELTNTRTFTAKGDGTFVCSTTKRTYTAERVYDFYISQYCSHCGKRQGDGTNGTCTYFLYDKDCPKCGEHCEALKCHTCDE